MTAWIVRRLPLLSISAKALWGDHLRH